MDLKKITSGKIELGPKDIVGFAVVRNEALRLPYFLSYYRNLGVDQFVFIDNNSNDKTVEILSNFENAHVFSTEGGYGRHWSWIEHLLTVYGLNRWCLVIDADELLFYPHCSSIKLPKLCEFLSLEGSRATHCILLDMYSNIPIEKANYKQGQDPLAAAPWFDAGTHHKMRSRYYGGMRERVFGITPCITKYPLFFFDKSFRISRGTHEISEKPTRSVGGVLMHFKYLQDFMTKAFEGFEGGQYWNNSFEYRVYAEVLKLYPNLNLWYQDSVKFIDTEQLVKLGIAETSDSFEKYVFSQVFNKRS